MKLLVSILVSVFGLASAVQADDDPQVLARNLKDLYVLHSPIVSSTGETENFLEVLLTLNSYQGGLSVKDVASFENKYEIFIGDAEAKVLTSFVFYFGGPQQFAVKIADDRELLVGKVGEYVKADSVRAFAGLRADPAFYDKTGYRGFINDRCLPESGFRCSAAGAVENYFQNKNVLALALSINQKFFEKEDGSLPTKFSVWAKAYARDE